MPQELDKTEWLTLKEAARRIDVHPTTLRRWADNGNIPVLLTPGGHRRFSASDVAQFVQVRKQSTFAAPLAMTWATNALQRARHEIGATHGENWIERFDGPARQRYRTLGRRLLGLALEYVSEDPPDETVLEEARSIGREYAIISRSVGLKLTDAMKASMFFRDSLVGAALQLPAKGRIRTEAEADLVRRINVLLNNVQLAVAEVYDADDTDTLPRS
jgi:excisionase family DNA binding protein